ncbi:MAG: DUF4926 domain-containing protein [Syntrophus sp. (in: bacteria)]
MIKELDDIILTSDLPQHGLAKDDIGTVVLVHNNGEGYEVEFTTLDGETLTVATLPASYVRPVRSGEIPHARQLATA